MNDFDFVNPKDALPEPGERVLVYTRKHSGELVPSIAWIVNDDEYDRKVWGLAGGWRMDLDSVILWHPIPMPDPTTLEQLT